MSEHGCYGGRSAWAAGVAGAVLLAGGCTVGPDFQPPAASVPGRWDGLTLDATGGVTPSVAVEREADLARWWEILNDPTLTSLVHRAVEGNPSIDQASARIRVALASRRIAASALAPQMNLGAGATRSRGAGADARTQNLFQIGLDGSLALDVFGGIRRSIEAAEADLAAAVEDQRDVLVLLTGQVALAYADLRGLQRQLEVARRTLAAQEQTVAIVRDRFEAGFVSALDLANAEAQAATTRSRIPAIEGAGRQALYALSVLIGREPAALNEELATTSPLPAVPPEIPVGLPSDLLRRRPDIRRAEADIHGATARIGVATADLFPRFSLGAGIGLRGDELGDLGSIVNRFWSIGPSASWNVFDGGRTRAGISQQEAFLDLALATYRQTVLGALQEVESALVQYAREQQRYAALADAVAANRDAVRIAAQLYEEGQTDFLNLLNAQRSLYDSEDALAQSERLVVQNLATLYRALGGGWREGDLGW